MGRLNPFVARHREHTTGPRAVAPAATLSEFYGDQVPATALLLEDYLHMGRIPIRDPEGIGDEVVTVELQQAAQSFGGDLTETRSYLHRMHAAGVLTIDQHGTVEFARP
jgi:hypothetical protein